MRDLFGKNMADSTTSKLTVSSAHPYNAEKHRVTVDGVQVLPEYGSVSQYNHTGKLHQLQPNVGETVALQSAQRPAYVVQYEMAASLAFAANKKASGLTGDDRIRVGRFDGTDGYAFEVNSGHEDNRADLVILQGGSVEDRKPDVNVREKLDLLTRLLVRGAWYDVSRTKWKISVAVSGEQINSKVGQHGMAGKGPNTPNLPVRFEVRADSSTSDLVLNAGSFGLTVWGKDAGIVRTKEITRPATLSNVGSFEALFAFRKDPNRQEIPASTINTEILSYGTTDLFEVFFQSFTPGKVDFGSDGWSVPPEWSETNNNMEFRSDVQQIPDETGAKAASPSSLGGIQLNYNADVGGKKSESGTSPGSGQTVKAEITEDRIGVVVGKVESGGQADQAIVYNKFTQGW